MLRLVREELGIADADSLVIDEGPMAFTSDEWNGASVDNFMPELRNRVSRYFSTIQALIDENNRSRLLHGVHWEFDSTEGAKGGLSIAEQIFANVYQPL